MSGIGDYVKRLKGGWTDGGPLSGFLDLREYNAGIRLFRISFPFLKVDYTESTVYYFDMHDLEHSYNDQVKLEW